MLKLMIVSALPLLTVQLPATDSSDSCCDPGCCVTGGTQATSEAATESATESAPVAGSEATLPTNAGTAPANTEQNANCCFPCAPGCC